MSETKEVDWAETIGKPAFESIAEMVAALECDYDRLEELREARDDFATENPPYEDGDGLSVTPTLANSHADDAEELAELEAATGECKDRDEARQRIEEDALSVEVRSGWVEANRGTEDMTAEEFAILLATGGPAVRIRGELDRGEATRAWLEVQDWGKPWTEYVPADKKVLLAYAGCFFYGE